MTPSLLCASSQGPKEVEWSKFKGVDKPLLDLFRKSFTSAAPCCIAVLQ